MKICYWCGHDIAKHVEVLGCLGDKVCMEKDCKCQDGSDEPHEFTVNTSGYPSIITLAQVRAWPYQDCKGLLEYIEDYWNQHGRIWRHRNYVMLATGGWSGNEDILGEIPAMITAQCWYASYRGGKHIYKLPTAPEP